ncbi:MAG: hypothetical protein WC364_05920 [Eubacteriales bacterium]|jgi:hypothetical protein
MPGTCLAAFAAPLVRSEASRAAVGAKHGESVDNTGFTGQLHKKLVFRVVATSLPQGTNHGNLGYC